MPMQADVRLHSDYAIGAYHGSAIGAIDIIIHCPLCGAVPVPGKPAHHIAGRCRFFAQNPLASQLETLTVKCGGPAEREQDTFDIFLKALGIFAVCRSNA